MKLVIFDIDGTLIDSVNTDDQCFIQAFHDLFKIDISNADWNEFEHVTDSGLTIEILKKYLQRIPKEKEIQELKSLFYRLLYLRKKEFNEILGAKEFINKLIQHDNLKIAFATGGWKHTAFLKLESIGLSLKNFVFKTSDDHYSRKEIINLVIKESQLKYKVNTFESIIYFGDGLWDLEVTRKLKIQFIGIDRNNKLKKAGTRHVIYNYLDPNNILSLIS